VKTRIFALAVALATLASNASAATYNLSTGGSLFIAGAISGMERISILFTVDATIRDPSVHLADWNGFVTGRSDLSGGQAFGLGACLIGPCGGFGLGPPSGALSLLISDASRTISWTMSFSGPNALLSPHVTLTLPDGLVPVPTPLPAALPLFAAGLAAVVWFGRRRRAAPPRDRK
jgi:hypothetical protein